MNLVHWALFGHLYLFSKWFLEIHVKPCVGHVCAVCYCDVLELILKNSSFQIIIFLQYTKKMSEWLKSVFRWWTDDPKRVTDLPDVTQQVGVRVGARNWVMWLPNQASYCCLIWLKPELLKNITCIGLLKVKRRGRILATNIFHTLMSGIYFLEVVLILTVPLQSGVIIPVVQGKEWRLREVSNFTSVAQWQGWDSTLACLSTELMHFPSHHKASLWMVQLAII